MNRRDLFTRSPAMGVALAGAALTALASPAEASGGGEGAAKPSANSYVRFGTVTATVMRPNGQRGVMTVETGLDIPDEDLRTQATLDGPRLRAAFNTVVQAFAVEMLPGAAPDVDRLHHQLQVATIKTLKKRGALVLLGTVMLV